MEHKSAPYPVPRVLPPHLARVLAYWQKLKRSAATMPFWDDVDLSALPDLSPFLMLIDVFDIPTRMRVALTGEEISKRYGDDLTNRFLDEIEIRPPIEYLASQSIATIERGAPSFFSASKGHAAGYSRLVLPMWGNGYISMLLVAIVVE